MRDRLKRELQVFQMLSPQSRALLLCSQLFRLAGPFIGLFLNLYLWRQTNNLPTLILYNICGFVALPFGFVVNGLILRKVSINLLFPIGFLSQIIFPLLIVLLRESALSFLVPLGLIGGFGAAFYWANLNYLTFRLTTDENRSFYIGYDYTLGSLIGTLAPVLAGFIVGLTAGGYYLSFMTAVVIFIVGALVAKKYLASETQPVKFDLKGLVVTNGGQDWGKARALIFLWGTMSGATLFTGSVLALEFFQKEFNVGLFNGIAGAVGILSAYLAGRYATAARRKRAAALGIIVLVIGALAFGLAPVLVGYVIYIFSNQIGGFFIWTVNYGFILREYDRGSLSLEQKYHYVVDNEIFINLGRILGLSFFLLPLLIFGVQTSFRLIILSTIIIWLANFLIVRRLSAHSSAG